LKILKRRGLFILDGYEKNLKLTPGEERCFDQEFEITCTTTENFHKITIKIERFDCHPTESCKNEIMKQPGYHLAPDSRLGFLGAGKEYDENS